MRATINRQEGLVYSTELGKMCPECGHSAKECGCRKARPGPPQDGIVRIGRETKGRKGAGVTIISGLPLADEGLKALARRLKQRCGTGGTVKAGRIEIQGDHRDVLRQELGALGYTVKLAGG
ncbi:MAG: translation initiation factor Sui1 [Syntrophales bacterium]